MKNVANVASDPFSGSMEPNYVLALSLRINGIKYFVYTSRFCIYFVGTDGNTYDQCTIIIIENI